MLPKAKARVFLQWAERGYVHGRKEGRAHCCCWLGREYLLLCRERRGKRKRLIRTFKTLYGRISVVRVVQASRRCDQTVNYLFRMMGLQSLQIKMLLKSAGYYFSSSVTHLLYFFTSFFCLCEQKRIIDKLEKLHGQPVIF